MAKRIYKGTGKGNPMPIAAQNIKNLSKMPFTSNQFELYKIGCVNLRARMYENPLELEEIVYKYFEWCEANKESLTITGLALYVGFGDKSLMYNYAMRNDYIFLKNALLIIEGKYEKGLESMNCVGSIFALKNMGWVDKVENIHSYNDIALNMAIEDNEQIPKLEEQTDSSYEILPSDSDPEKEILIRNSKPDNNLAV